jgi:hypothetical protein
MRFVSIFVILFGMVSSISSVHAQAVWQSTETKTGNGTSFLVSKPESLAVGDLMVAAIMIGTPAEAATFTAPSGWTSILVEKQQNQLGMATFYKVVTLADLEITVDNYTFTKVQSGNVRYAVSISHFTGADPVNPIFDSASGKKNTRDFNAPGVDAETDMLVLTYFTHRESAQLPTQEGYTRVHSFFEDNPNGPSNTLFTKVADEDGTTDDLAFNLAGTGDMRWIGMQISIKTALQPPSNLMYVNEEYTFIYGTEITSLIPTYDGDESSFSIDPALPNGLYFDPSTGTISGTPLQTSPQTSYTVTAENDAGDTSVVIDITVNQRPITLTVDSGLTKVYGDPDVELTYSLTEGTLVDPDYFSGELGRDAGENVGDYPINIGSLVILRPFEVQVEKSVSELIELNSPPPYVDVTQYYDITFEADNLSITERELEVSGVLANSKVYDGSTVASLNISSYQWVNAVSGDEINLVLINPIGEFESANVGSQISVTPDLSVSGSAASNYSFQQPELFADIVQKIVIIAGTFTANDKPFDENTNATFSSNNLVLVGFIGSDDDNVSLSNVEIDFDDAFFDGLQPVRITSASLSGSAAGNYEILLAGAPTAEARIIMFRIWGYKFEDMNNNGVWDDGEPGVEGWEIRLGSANGAEMTYTDANGFYAFDHILPGSYSVLEGEREGWQQSAPGGEGFVIVNVNLPRTLARVDFGNYRNASVSGFVYNDQTGSGSFDEGEVGLEGVTVNVVNLSNVIVGTTQTDGDGNFSIGGIAPGTYSVRIMPPNDMIQSQPEDFYPVTLGSGAQESDLHFGLFEAIDLNVFVFIREATKQIAETQDFALSGVKVSGVRSGPAPLKTTSTGPAQSQSFASSSFESEIDENGFFTATDLLPGEYTVSVTVPDNWIVFTENPVQISMIASFAIEIEFGIEYDVENAPEIATSSITGSVFADVTGLGTWPNASVNGLSGQNVTLAGTTRRGDDFERTTTTGTGGLFSFTELPAGKYMVSVAPSSGLSLSSPGGSSYSIQLGDNQHIGEMPTTSSPIATAPGGAASSFAKMTLSLDTNADGSADTVVELAGNATFDLGGFIGQTSRPLTLESFAGRGSDNHGHPVTLSAPGLYKQAGTLESSLSGSSASFGVGMTLSLDDELSYAIAPVVFTGSVSSWPARHQTFTMTNTQPVPLQSTMGSVIGHIITASLTPMHGADLGLQRADFGDAPASYGTLRAAPSDDFVVFGGVITYPNDGARHLLPFSGTASLVLGNSVTADQDGKPTAMADGDTDDGVDVPAQMERGASTTLTVRVTGTGLLSVWADWNRNGNFDAGEQIITDLAVSGSSTPYALSINVPASGDLGQTYLRFRISSQAGLSATGMASDGEVEDYAVNVVNELDNSDEDLSTNLDRENSGLPTSFALRQNYPNPFNPTTVIPYELAGAGLVRLAVYDVTGRMVSTLISAEQSAGRYTATFNAAGLPSGVYMVRLEAGGQVMTRKLTLLK